MSVKRRFWGWLTVGLGLILAERTITNIIRLYKASDRVKTAEIELANLKMEKVKLEGELAETKTEEFMERIAREKLGLGKPGEIVVVMDEDKVISHQSSVINEVSNWKRWRKLYLGW